MVYILGLLLIVIKACSSNNIFNRENNWKSCIAGNDILEVKFDFGSPHGSIDYSKLSTKADFCLKVCYRNGSFKFSS